MKRLAWLPWLVVAGCGLYASLFLYHATRLVLFPYDMDNSEGLLLYQAMRIADATFLYHPITEQPFLVDNYPPVYPLLSAFFVWITGPSLFGLRLLSLLATLGTACLIAAWVYRTSENRLAALVGGLVYLCFYHVYQWGALARVDAVGGFFALAALLWYLHRRDWLGTSLLLLLALFTKQSLLAAPLALGVWLLCQKNYAHVIRLSLTTIITGVLLLIALIALSGGEAYSHLVSYNANAFFLWDVWLNMRHWFQLYTFWGCLPFAFVLLLFVSRTSDEALLGWFSLFAIGEALLVGKIGSAPNYFLSLCAVSAIGVGVLFSRVMAMQKSDSAASPVLMVTVCSLFVMQLAATIHWPHSPVQFAETPTTAMAQEGQFVERELNRIEGPVFAELPTIALRAGHPAEFQPFIFTQLTREGRWDQAQIVTLFQQQHFERIVLQFDLASPAWDTRRFTPAMIESMRSFYQLDKTVGRYYLYKPSS